MIHTTPQRGMQMLAAIVTCLILLSTQLVPAPAQLCTDQMDKVRLEGLLEINPTSNCDRDQKVFTYGLSLALAIEYIIDIVNNTNTQLSVDGVQYEFQLENICMNRSLATRSAAINIPTSLWTNQSSCPDQSSANQFYSADNSLLLGFIGPAYSSNAKYVAEFLNNTNIPVITPSATITELADKMRYHSLLRTAVSDDKQGKAMIEVVVKMQWSYILLIHTDDSYGRQGAQTIRHYGELERICFSNVIEVQLEPEEPSAHYESIGRRIKSDTAMGIIYFGTETAGQAIIENYLNLVRQSSVENRKVMLASEGIGTYPGILDSLESNNNKLGLITMAPYNKPTNLHDYIKERISKTKTGIQATNDLVEQFVECAKVGGCEESELTMATDATQQTIDSVVSLLHAFKQTHTKLCHGNAGLCSELSESTVFYSSMLSSLFESEVNVDIDNLNISVKFDSDGELDRSTEGPAFSLNVAVESANDWLFSRAALYYHNDTWVFSDNSLLTGDFGSRCTLNCEVCQRVAAPYIYRRSEKSRYIIAGTAAVNDEQDQHNCGQKVTLNGFVMMESFYYAVEQIEAVTGMQFATLFIDTCYARLETHAIMNEIFREQDKAYLVDWAGVEWPIRPTDFVVFIGDASSGVSLVLQTYLSLYNIPQISYRSTSVWLSDSLRYPMFLRNVPSDDQQARLMIDIIKRNGWNNIGLIQSDSVYGQTGGELVMEYASDAGICISYRQVAQNTDDALTNLARDTKATAKDNRLPTVIVIFAEEGFIAKFIKKIQIYDKQWKERGNVLIGSETWNKLEHVIEDVEEFVYGSLTFSFSDSTFSWIVDGSNDFQRFLHTQRPENNNDNPLFIHFWQQYFKCYLPQDSMPYGEEKCDQSLSLAYTTDVSDQLESDDVVGKHVVMAGMSVAYAIREGVYGESKCQQDNGAFNCSNLFDTESGRLDFFRYLQETKIPQQVNSSSKTYLPFLASGDGQVNYKIYNIIKQGSDSFYQTSYEVTEGVVVEVSAPQFYSDGVLDIHPDSECTSNCQCVNLRQTAVSPTNLPTDGLLWAPPGWLLPLLILIIVFLIMLLVVVVAYILLTRKGYLSKSKKYEQIPMQRFSREELPATPAPHPTTTHSVPSPFEGQPANSYVREPRTLGTTSNGVQGSQRQSTEEYLQFSPSQSVIPSQSQHGFARAAANIAASDGNHYEVPDSYSLGLQSGSNSSHQLSTSGSANQPAFYNPDPKAGTLNEHFNSRSPESRSTQRLSGRRSPPGEESTSSATPVSSRTFGNGQTFSNSGQPQMDAVKTVD